MRKVKFLFFGYLAFVALLIGGVAVAFNAAPPRDPHTFYYTYSGAIKTLDPAEVNDTVGSLILGYIYQGLYNYKYNTYPYQIVPELAAAMPTVSADGLTMTIPIKPGVHYFDPERTLWPDGVGPEITAADFVYSFKRVCNFNVASPNYSFVFQDNFVGLDQWWAYTKSTPTPDFDKPVAGFTALDPHTLQLKFTHPYAQMINNLVNNPTAPECRAIAEHWGEQVRKHPVGTGPYALAENLREQRIVLTANPLYHSTDDSGGPHIPRVQLDYFQEPMPAWLLFQQGLFDVAGIPKDGYSQAISLDSGDLTPAMTQKGIELVKYPVPATTYIGINMADPVLGRNKPLRQAMSMSIDRATFIKNFLNGRGTPAITPVPPGFPTFDEKGVNPYTQFDLTKARALMADAIKINKGPLPPFTLLMRDADTTSRQMAEYYASQMAQFGITLVPVYRDFARWQQMVDDRQTQLFDGGWEADYPDEQDFLQLFYGKNAPAGGLNGTAYVNPAFDALYEKASLLQDSPQRRSLYVQMQNIVDDDCPWISVHYETMFALSYNWVKNRHHMDYGHGYAQYVQLDEESRRKHLGH